MNRSTFQRIRAKLRGGERKQFEIFADFYDAAVHGVPVAEWPSPPQTGEAYVVAAGRALNGRLAQGSAAEFEKALVARAKDQMDHMIHAIVDHIEISGLMGWVRHQVALVMRGELDAGSAASSLDAWQGRLWHGMPDFRTDDDGREKAELLDAAGRCIAEEYQPVAGGESPRLRQAHEIVCGYRQQHCPDVPIPGIDIEKLKLVERSMLSGSAHSAMLAFLWMSADALRCFYRRPD